MKLYDYAHSSASYRVRIALHLKGLPFETTAIDLLAGQQREPSYSAVNPQQLVPTLVDGAVVVGQSLAAIEYLDERYPRPPLLPTGAAARARVRQLALIVACEIHPLQNPATLRAIGARMGGDEDAQRAWARDVIGRGLAAFARALRTDRPPGPFCHGDQPTLADLFLVPQLMNARRYGCGLESCEELLAIERACLELPAFRRAAPQTRS